MKMAEDRVHVIDPVPADFEQMLDFGVRGFPVSSIPEEWGRSITVFNRSVEGGLGFGGRTLDDRGMALLPVGGSGRTLAHEWGHALTGDVNWGYPLFNIMNPSAYLESLTFSQQLRARIQAGKGG